MNNMHEILHSLLELSGQRDFPDASEMHGLLCAHACVANTADHAAGARELLRWLGTDAQAQRLLEVCGSALQATTALLLDPASDFHPLLPADAATLQERTEALAAWAGGFVSGMGVHGDVRLTDTASEAMSDLQQIARAAVSQLDVDAQAESSAQAQEAQEQAYTELVEYTRVAVPLIHHALLLQQRTSPPAVLH